MNATTAAASFDCIRIIDTATDLLETFGMASTERIAAAVSLPVSEVRGVMFDLQQRGAVVFSGGLQVWMPARD